VVRQKGIELQSAERSSRVTDVIGHVTRPELDDLSAPLMAHLPQFGEHESLGGFTQLQTSYDTIQNFQMQAKATAMVLQSDVSA